MPVSPAACIPNFANAQSAFPTLRFSILQPATNEQQRFRERFFLFHGSQRRSQSDATGFPHCGRAATPYPSTSDPMPPPLANRLGTTAHLSALLQKTKRLGVRTPEDLEHIALTRGLRYFGRIDLSSDQDGPKSEMPALDPELFSNEELAIALMSPSLPYSLNRLRMAAAMLGADGISAEKILRLARMERCETIVRHIAEAAVRVEPDDPLWQTLLNNLPAPPPLRPDLLPHPSRFVAMSGLDRSGRNLRTQWIRPCQ